MSSNTWNKGKSNLAKTNTCDIKLEKAPYEYYRCLYVKNVCTGIALSRTLQAISTYKTRLNTYQLSPQLDAPLPHTKWLPTRDIGFVVEVFKQHNQRDTYGEYLGVIRVIPLGSILALRRQAAQKGSFYSMVLRKDFRSQHPSCSS